MFHKPDNNSYSFDLINMVNSILPTHNLLNCNNSNIIKTIYDHYYKSGIYSPILINMLQTYMKRNSKIKSIIYKFYHKLKHPFITYCNDYDIYNIDRIDKLPNIITIQKNNYIWRFEPSQLLEMITNDLCFNQDLFPEPRTPRNPYTNKNFNQFELIKIYNELKEMNIRSIYFDLFRKYQFDIKKFSLNCFYILKEISVKDTINNLMPYDYDFQVYLGELFQDSGNDFICYECLSKKIIVDKDLCLRIKKILINYLLSEDNTAELKKIYKLFNDSLKDLYKLYINYPNHNNKFQHPEKYTFAYYSGLTLVDMVFNVGVRDIN